MYLLFNRQFFSIKRYEREQVLLDLVDGSRYDLEADQLDFLILCDGTKTVQEILDLYEEDFQQIVRDFIDNLLDKKVILFIETSQKINVCGKLILDPRLEYVHIEATSKCNMRCIHCYQGETYPVSKNLTVNEVFRLIDEMAAMQVEGITISGGEPFFDEKTFLIIEYLEKKGMGLFSIFTNGLLVNEEMIYRIKKYRSRPTVFVSLDAITPDAMIFRGFNVENGRKVIRVILANIRSLIDNGFPVIVNTVLNRSNIDSLLQMYEAIKDSGVLSWRVGFPKRTGFLRDNPDFELPWEEMANASFCLLEHHLAKRRPFNLQLEYLYREELFKDFHLLSDEDFVCDYEGKRETCCIKPNGDVVSCAYCGDLPTGNIRQDSLSNIWHSSQMRMVKRIKIKDVSECRDCDLKQYCATGCRINAFFLHGDFENAKDDYACNSVRFFVNKILPLLKSEGIIV